eukprot:2843821-Amphidinium_carterae.1
MMLVHIVDQRFPSPLVVFEVGAAGFVAASAHPLREWSLLRRGSWKSISGKHNHNSKSQTQLATRYRVLHAFKRLCCQPPASSRSSELWRVSWK